MCLHVWVVEFEAFIQAFANEVECRAVEKRKAFRIDEHCYPMAVEAAIIRQDFVDKLKRVRETLAAAGAHTQPQADARAALSEKFLCTGSCSLCQSD